ncbi:hypothetical protein GE09DRAFT_1053802 [Coniochaeta sp. 2T2.1]|nr:hypothetical protein GE09DRAFT_1053802 [Coniochaeta sp. 2T2.1]
MDRNPNCNVFQCAAPLKDEVWVTSCSHIFCSDCSHQSGLSSSDGRQRTCPACGTQLPNPDDVFRNELNPSETWKTNILGGLGPSVIMEAAGKALSFWGYQMAMQMTFLESECKRRSNEFDQMSSKYEEELNRQKAMLDRQEKRIESLMGTVEEQRQSIDSISSQLRDKSQRLTQTQELYNKIKRQKLLDQIDYTNSQVVEPVMEPPANGPGPAFVDQRPGQQSMYPPGTVVSPAYPNAQASPRYSLGAHVSLPVDSGMHRGTGNQYSNAYAGVQPLQNTGDRRSQHRAEVHATPQTYRHQPAGNTSIGLSTVPDVVAGTPMGSVRGTPRVGTDPARRFTEPRQPQRPAIRFPTAGQVSGAVGLNASRHAPNDSRASYERMSDPSISLREPSSIFKPTPQPPT